LRSSAWGNLTLRNSKSAGQRDRRTPIAKRAARLAYQRLLQRVLTRKFLGFKVAKLSTSMDLEQSFGPIYTRGLLQQGQSAFAVLGVNAQETDPPLMPALNLASLWLDVCRQTQAGKQSCTG